MAQVAGNKGQVTPSKDDLGYTSSGFLTAAERRPQFAPIDGDLSHNLSDRRSSGPVYLPDQTKRVAIARELLEGWAHPDSSEINKRIYFDVLADWQRTLTSNPRFWADYLSNPSNQTISIQGLGEMSGLQLDSRGPARKEYVLKWPGFEPMPRDTDGRSLWALLDTIYFQEVEPDTGAPVVIERLQPLPGALDWDVGRLSDEPEVLRRQNCGNAIRELRKPYHLAALGTGWINGIAGAHELCLAKKPSGMPVSLSASEREHVERCGEAYRAVVEFCFSSDGISWEQQARIAAHVGIIVTPDRGTGSGRTIRCSATRVGKRHIVSARHCLKEFQLVPGAPVGWFLPLDQTVSPDWFEIISVRIGPRFERIELHAVGDIPALGSGSIEDDVAIFELAEELGPTLSSQDTLTLRPAKLGQPAALAAYQRLAARAVQITTLLAEGIIPNDEALLVSGEWRKAFLFDTTPTCALLEFNEEEATLPGNEFDRSKIAGHMCQSLESSSGGALISYSRDTLGEIHVVAVHGGAAAFASMIQGPVEAHQPRNYGILINPEIIEAIRAAEADF